MSRFKVGDRVRCVSVAAPLDPLTVGGDYVVQGIDPDMGFVRVIADDGRLGGWFSERFVLATTPPPRDLNPFEWDPQVEMRLNGHCTNLPHKERVVAFARWLWAVTELPFTFGDTPDTVTEPTWLDGFKTGWLSAIASSKPLTEAEIARGLKVAAEFGLLADDALKRLAIDAGIDHTIEPMTTVDEDGRVFRLMAHGSWLTKRNPDGTLHCNHSDREHCTRDHDTEITYRLVPIEDPS